MHRLILGALVVLLSALLLLPASASHESVQLCEKGLDEARLSCRVVAKPHPGTGRVPGVQRPAPQRPVAGHILYRPEVVRGGDGLCIAFRTEVFPGAADSRDASDAEFLLMRFIRNYPICAGQPRPPASPSAVAREVIEHIDLPAPAIEIDPGHAITGLKAYLETKGTLHPAPFVRPTPLGEITVDADGEYVVDWGDGTPTERYGFEGEAWPDGRISHVYTHIGRYHVVVTVEWVARWAIGERRGTVSGLRTSGRIDGFEVRQLQAVRNR